MCPCCLLADLDLAVTNGYVLPETTYDDEWNFTPNSLYINENGEEIYSISVLCNVTKHVFTGMRPHTAQTAKPFQKSKEDMLGRTMGRGLGVFDFNNDGAQDIVIANFAVRCFNLTQFLNEAQSQTKIHILCSELSLPFL